MHAAFARQRATSRLRVNSGQIQCLRVTSATQSRGNDIVCVCVCARAREFACVRAVGRADGRAKLLGPLSTELTVAKTIHSCQTAA